MQGDGTGRQMKLIDWLRDLPFRFALWIVDLVGGPEPETEADRIREARRGG
jgi:hypothetical protein